MSLPGLARLRAALRGVPAARMLHARLVSGGVILLYHRVAALRSDPYALCVDPARFEEHLQLIRRFAHPLRLAEMARAVRARRIPKRAVCVTFDDGYRDNLYAAAPLLERHDVPATVFVTTGRVGRDREFWWDELERILLAPPVVPERLEIRLCGRSFDLDLGDSARRAEEAPAHDAGWNLGADDDPSPRHAAFRAIYDLLQPRSGREQAEALDRLAEWSGVAPITRATHRALEPEEVRTLDGHGIIDVGSHTVDHPALRSQPLDVQREEIGASRSTLEEWLGRSVDAFSYPYGLYSPDSVAEVKRAGYSHACACIGQPTRRDSDPWELPRVDAPDVDGDGLARLLSALLGRRIGSPGRGPRPR